MHVDGVHLSKAMNQNVNGVYRRPSPCPTLSGAFLNRIFKMDLLARTCFIILCFCIWFMLFPLYFIASLVLGIFALAAFFTSSLMQRCKND